MKAKARIVPSATKRRQKYYKELFAEWGKLGKASDIPKVEYVIIDDDLCDIAGRKCGRLK